MLLDILYIVIGLLLLVKGGDYLVDGSVILAQKAKMSKMVIGLTVIGFGTSMPELLVSAQAALENNPGIAIGNVVGSNISNIALILGLSALFCPIPAKRSTLVQDIPFMILASILFVGVALTGIISRVWGILFIGSLVAYIAWQIFDGRKKSKAEAPAEAPKKSVWAALFIIAASFAALVAGAKLLVYGGSAIARELGVTDRMIGLTIVAVGTSLPELFASVMAAYKKEADMAIGNIIGSVSFNILCVVGASAAICPILNSAEGFLFDYLAMITVGIILWFFLYTHRSLVRYEGAILVLLYVAYIIRTIVIG